MAANWRRWFRYGRAKVDDLLAKGNRDLDRREAELAARREGKPWVGHEGDSPTVEQVRAKIEHQRAEAAAAAGKGSAVGPGPDAESGDLGFDLAEQQRRADDRLSAIRDELGLTDDEPPPSA